MIEFGIANSTTDFAQIIALQNANLERSISNSESKEQGFVTLQYDIETLREFSQPYPHIVARDSGNIIGYTLVMLREMQHKIPLLVPMFQKINQLQFKERSLQESKYFVMGQVCIEKGYRGQGVFRGLYNTMKKEMSSQFDYLITEVATRNTRSMKAHQNVGFQNLLTYTQDEEEWSIIIWDWN